MSPLRVVRNYRPIWIDNEVYNAGRADGYREARNYWFAVGMGVGGVVFAALTLVLLCIAGIAR